MKKQTCITCSQDLPFAGSYRYNAAIEVVETPGRKRQGYLQRLVKKNEAIYKSVRGLVSHGKIFVVGLLRISIFVIPGTFGLKI